MADAARRAVTLDRARAYSRHLRSPRSWGRFKAAYKASYGRSLGNIDEPDGLHPENFGSKMSEARSADEPAHLSSYDFTEDRLRRLVRDGVERELVTIGRSAEILGLSLAEMRKLVASWAEI